MAKVRSINDIIKFKSMDWNDPSGPLRKMVIHSQSDLSEYNCRAASDTDKGSYYQLEQLERTQTCSAVDKPTYVIAHIHHPREITQEVRKEFKALQDAGFFITNQTQVLRGINDDPFVLAELLKLTTQAGIMSTSFVINRPVAESRSFSLPLECVYQLVEEAAANTPGPGERARLYMNHSSGQIEILAIEDGKAYLKFRQTGEGKRSKLMIVDYPKNADWFEDLPVNEQQWKQSRLSINDGDSEHDLMSLPGSITNQYFIEMSD